MLISYFAAHNNPQQILLTKMIVARLCGVHCLNTLLQGSYFTEVDLAQVALELDKQEKKLMMEMGTDTPEFLKFMAEDSGNVDDSGDYSIQVLQQALHGWDLKCIPVSNPEATDALTNPVKENAFICNLSNHWFTIRKCGDKWYNLNSLNKQPELVTDFYLSLYLATLASSGWSIFVVKGSLPPVTHSTITSEGGAWIPIEQCVQKKAAPKQEIGEDDLAAAIRLSLASAPSDALPPSSTSSSSPSYPTSGAKPKRPIQEVEEEVDENDAELQAVLEASELEAAIAASLQK